ncbi:hypothetical protein C7H19_11830 [Aphanothece hegewaldii CCALA 016]|uniref:Uncharacterized protein n=1 Tax=Aphanothece hegewaldii CCALA 016 TaxID=2107694 RepID=A0A2T1LXN4_9CHRO|nr:hypothetical protein [Aphanothece hegewaldii]PSF37121.1 hypothetical protein C7H19_11830 [Aphanothece hegewaldii CCALA 016]
MFLIIIYIEKVPNLSYSQKEKTLKIAFLYYLVFASKNNLITKFEERLLPYLKSSNPVEKKETLIAIKDNLKELNVQKDINKLKKLITKFLSKKTI